VSTKPGGEKSRASGGHVLYEVYLLAALVLISVAVGAGQYQEHGIGGAFLAAGITFVGIIVGVAGLVALVSGIGSMEKRFQGQGWYRWGAKLGRILVLLCLFSLFGAAVCGALVLRLDFPAKWQEPFMGIGALTIGGVVSAIRFRTRDAFWPGFGRLCLFLCMSVAGAVIGLVVAQWLPQSPSGNMVLVDAGALIPLGIYLFLFLRGGGKRASKESRSGL
jgi:hypothetical protein